MRQGISVANPPTLLLLVDRLLQGIGSGKSNGMGHDPEIKVYEKDASTTCEAGGDGEGGHIDPTLEFLTRIKAPLDEWMRWLLTTQRPGAQGWGGQDSRSPMGAFQVGRDRFHPLPMRRAEHELLIVARRHGGGRASSLGGLTVVCAKRCNSLCRAYLGSPHLTPPHLFTFHFSLLLARTT